MRRMRIAVAVSLGLLLCLIAWGAELCAATLHIPRSAPPDPPNTATAEVMANDGAQLRASWFPAASKSTISQSGAVKGRCVIALHGIGDTRSGMLGYAQMFLGAGYSVLTPDSRAHGTSGGELITYGLLEKYDTIAWVNWMRAQGCAKIYGFGESLGASVLIQAAALQPAFSGIAAEGAFADLSEVGKYRLGKQLGLPTLISNPLAGLGFTAGMLYARIVEGLDFNQVNPLKSIREASTPVLLIHGLDDSRTPPSQSKELAAANPGNSLWLVPNAEHVGASQAEPQEFRRRVLAWFAEH